MNGISGAWTTTDRGQGASDKGDPLDAASHLFARLAKAQPFGDGNKRGALLAANGLLGAWHMHDDRIIVWLADWNRVGPEIGTWISPGA